MDMFDEARAIRSTMELCGMTQKELAQQLGTSQSYIANKLRLLNFSEGLIERIRESGVSERHARALLRLGEDEARLRILDAVVLRGLTVRECEAMVDSEVISKIPDIFTRGKSGHDVERFRVAITEAVRILASRGINAKARTNYSGRDMYITISIKEV